MPSPRSLSLREREHIEALRDLGNRLIVERRSDDVKVIIAVIDDYFRRTQRTDAERSPSVHYGSRGQAECGADYPNMALTTVPANVTCRTCCGWLPIVAPREHDQSCEAELTSHGHTPCQCAKRQADAERSPSPAFETIEVIVNGQPVTVKAGPIRQVVADAIQAAGQIGAPVDQWVLRTREGDIIPHDLPGGLDYALIGGQRVFMHLGLPALAMERSPSPAALDAIADMQFARQSHLAWAEHLEAHAASGEPCPQCEGKPYKLNAEHEREWVAKYDRVLSILAVERGTALPQETEDKARASRAQEPELGAVAQPRARIYPHEVEEVWRLDDDGGLDDVCVPNVDTFRLERMGTHEWWIGLYLADGRLVHIDLVGGKRGTVATKRDD